MDLLVEEGDRAGVVVPGQFSSSDDLAGRCRLANALVELPAVVLGLDALGEGVVVAEERDHRGEFFLGGAFEVRVDAVLVSLVLVEYEGCCVHGAAESVQLLAGPPALEPGRA